MARAKCGCSTVEERTPRYREVMGSNAIDHCTFSSNFSISISVFEKCALK